MSDQHIQIADGVFVKAETSPAKNIIPMRYCFNCGCEIGRSHYADRFASCGQGDCINAERDAHQAEREEAHEQLDRDLGY